MQFECFFPGKSIDIAQAGDLIKNTGAWLQDFRTDIDRFHGMWMEEISALCGKVGVEPSIPRRCGRQTQRSYVPAESVESYYQRSVTIPFLGEQTHLNSI